MGPLIKIERATLSHLPTIVEIYNQAVRRKFETADTNEFSAGDKQQWLENHDDGHPIYVAFEDGQLLGWYSLSPYREGRQALAGVREISYYVHSTHQQKGIGSLLMKHAIDSARQLGVEHLVAIVLDKNERSILLLKKFGFEQWGHLPGIADFDGERCGHMYYGLKIGVG